MDSTTRGYPFGVRQGAEPAAGADLRKVGIDPEHWYPLLRSRALRRGKAVGVSFAGEPIVLVRTESDAVFALEDRCAHRQVPLHAGVVSGERIQCCYHGWVYDSSGACVTVPYLDKGSRLPNGVRSYPCREAYGLIFVFPGSNGDDTPAFPDVSTWHDPRYRTRYLDRRVGCHYSFMHENLMDMNHQFLHRRLMGRIRARTLDVRSQGNRVEVDYTFLRTGGRKNVGEHFMVATQRREGSDRTHDLMTIATEYPYQVLRFWSAGDAEPALVLWNVYVPVDRKQRENHTFGLMMIRRPSVPGLIHLMWPFIVWFTEGIFAEDRWIVEHEQAAFDLQGEDWNQEISPVILALRSLLVRRGVPMDG
jgi:renierapurpurin 18,18'-hydroxylase